MEFWNPITFRILYIASPHEREVEHLYHNTCECFFSKEQTKISIKLLLVLGHLDDSVSSNGNVLLELNVPMWWDFQKEW